MTVDVCVIGAGAAGLIAARTLRRAGLSVRVLEARGRVGGRAWTERTSFGVPIDRGCAWLHSADRNPWTAYARDRGFTVVERSPNWQSRIGRAPMTAEFRARWDADWDRAEGAILAAAEAGRDVPASTVVPKDIPLRPLFGAIMTWAVGADLEELSTVDYAAYRDSEINWAVREGLGALVASVALDLHVTLDCPVQAIDWSGPRVRLETARGTTDCRAVIVTVPTSVLALGAPRFVPALPAGYEEAFANLPLGVANKVFVKLAHGALPLDGTQHVIARADTTRTASVTVRPGGLELIQLYFGGAYSRELEGQGALQDAARETLVGLFGAELGARIERMDATAWFADPYARGSYSVARPGFAHCRAVLATPLAERVFFAGEACSPGFFGTVHGAWESAVDAATRVVQQLSTA
jgi:monoamine oxidase